MAEIKNTHENIEAGSQGSRDAKKPSIEVYLEAYLGTDGLQKYELGDLEEKKSLLVTTLKTAMTHKFEDAVRDSKIPLFTEIQSVVVDANTPLQEAEDTITHAVANVEAATTQNDFVRATIAPTNESTLDNLHKALNNDESGTAQAGKNEQGEYRTVDDKLRAWGKSIGMSDEQIAGLLSILKKSSSRDYLTMISQYVSKRGLEASKQIKELSAQFKDKITSFPQAILKLRQTKHAEKVTRKLLEYKNTKQRSKGMAYLYSQTGITATTLGFHLAELKRWKFSDKSNEKKRMLAKKTQDAIKTRFKLRPGVRGLSEEIIDGWLESKGIRGIDSSESTGDETSLPSIAA